MLDRFEYELEHRDAEYGKKHEPSIGRKCSIIRHPLARCTCPETDSLAYIECISEKPKTPNTD
jgi:hypothetical protein